MKTKAHAGKIKPNLGPSTRPTVQLSKWRRPGFEDSFSYPVVSPSGLAWLTSDAAAMNEQKKQNGDSHPTPAARICTSPRWPPGTPARHCLALTQLPARGERALPAIVHLTTGDTNPEGVRLPR